MDSRLSRKRSMTHSSIRYLPDEVLIRIFSSLPSEDIGHAGSVCRRWRRLVKSWHVWRGKSYLSEAAAHVGDLLPIARALPLLKRLSIRKNDIFNVYFSVDLSKIEVQEWHNETVAAAVSSLITHHLSIDFCLLDENSKNCLLVKTHQLEQLQITAIPAMLPQESVRAKLQALTTLLSRVRLPHLQCVDVHTGDYSFEVNEDVDTDIMGTLSTLPHVNQVTIFSHCSLSWDTVRIFVNLQFLQLQDCTIEDISFLDKCPNLQGLSLDNCSPVKRRELAAKSELRGLLLRHLPVDSEFMETLCAACPNLDKILIDECQYITQTSFLRHCPNLYFVEVNGCGQATFPQVVGLPTDLCHLRLNSPVVTSEMLTNVIETLPHLKILDVVNCDVDSLSFLNLCTGLEELALGLEYRSTFSAFHELENLKNLKKLYLHYGESDIGPLSEVLYQMKQLECLDVGFLQVISDLSFLRYCHCLQYLTLGFYFPVNSPLSCFQELKNLTKLKKLDLDYYYLGVDILAEVLPCMPLLEELDIGFVETDCDFLFVRNCHNLTSLQVSCPDVEVLNLEQLSNLKKLRRLTVVGLSDVHRHVLMREVLELPELEFLGLEKDGPNFLESWEWRRLLSATSVSGRTPVSDSASRLWPLHTLLGMPLYDVPQEELD